MATSVAGRIASIALAVGASMLALPPVQAQEIPPPAYQIAARQAGVPSTVLYAIALQESGTRLHGRRVPWPWTLNVAGSAERYATRGQACVGLQRALQRAPAHRVDVGLGQINVGHHRARFGHPCDLLNPYVNLGIAATILREQHDEGSDWMVAVGRYHRPAGGEPAARYRRSVRQHLTRVASGPTQAAEASAALPSDLAPLSL